MCIVKGCPNQLGEGAFIGDLCLPCHRMLTTGEVKQGETFIHDMRDALLDVKDSLDNALESLRGEYN